MNWLLKITDGPMRGAEIALAEGMRLKVGRGDDCDIVIADVSLAEAAFELDVSSESVSLIGPDGVARALKPFEAHAFGTTAVAIGPADGVWGEIRPAQEETPAGETTEPANGGTPPEPAGEPPAESGESVPVESAPEGKKSRTWVVAVAACVVLVLAVVAVLWCFREPLAGRFPKVADVFGVSRKVSAPVGSVSADLAKLAKDHGLSFAETNGARTLSGNLAKRTEKQAIRALALSADRFCRLDLSDDESLTDSSAALLFAVTEGAVKVAKAANRAVSLNGYAPDAPALARVFEALRSDVPHADRIDAKGVRTGGTIPADLEGNVFARTGRLAQRTPPPAAVLPVKGTRTETGTNLVTTVKNAKTNTVVTTAKTSVVSTNAVAIPSDERPAAALASIADNTGGLLPKAALPVAGILMKPYTCVVLIDGHRLVEGAKISGLEIVRIEAERITFSWRGRTMRWEP